VWGNGTSAPDDDLESTHSHGDLISFRAKEDEIALQSPLNEPKLRNMTADDASQWIIQHTPLTFQVCGLELTCSLDPADQVAEDDGYQLLIRYRAR
jgi:phospholipid:diacylglycerol acyltransferase